MAPTVNTSGAIASVIDFSVHHVFLQTGIIFGVLLTALGLRMLYNIFLHPLRSYPGPKLFAATRLALIYYTVIGQETHIIRKLHQIYGPVVRICPHQLSYSDGTVFKEILGHRSDGEMAKDLRGAGFIRPPNGVDSILTANREDHSRHRRLIAHAFSEKALKEQEPYFQNYVNKLISRLHAAAETKKPQNMVRWYNFTTFDLIGDLAFGEPFGCLDADEYHPWVAMQFTSIKTAVLLRCLRYYNLMSLARFVMPRKLLKARADVTRLADEKVDRRIAEKQDRKDFLSYILRYNDERGMNLEELHSNASLLILAGSETTATLLSGATYYLLRNPEVYAKLCAEVRSRFTSDEEITLQSVGELEYMLAVLDESLRMYPPVPNAQQRVVPAGGAVLNGKFVPEGTTVGVSHTSTYRSPANFHRPDDFVPERFLPETAHDEKSPFYHDKRQHLTPFSLGARNCIGRNLAYAEMRIIMAKVLFNFDLELQPESARWAEEQKVFGLYDKQPLMVRLKPLVH